MGQIAYNQVSLLAGPDSMPGPPCLDNPVVITLYDGCKLHDDTELFSLLWVLRDRLIYRWGAECMKPRKNIALLTPDRWHITPQADELGRVPLIAISGKTESQEPQERRGRRSLV